jgi:hypothetical protein
VTSARDVRAAAGYAPKDRALRVRCTHCHALEGQPCTTRGRVRKDPHPCRVELAAATPEPAAEPTATVLPFQPRST